MPFRRLVRLAVTLGLAAMATASADGQRGGFRGGADAYHRAPYDGRFTFTRLRYNARGGGFGRGSNAWNHDYPRADRNLPLLLRTLTLIDANAEATNILDLEDPEIFENPVLYMWEPGGWRITEDGARNLRHYMLKGGFVVFDDFELDHWRNFETQFRQALPEAQFIRLDTSHPIFHAFYDIDSLNLPHPTMNVPPAFYGVFENNDPTGRMMALVFHNSDVAEYLGMVRAGLSAGEHHERRLQARRQPHDLRAVALGGVWAWALRWLPKPCQAGLRAAPHNGPFQRRRGTGSGDRAATLVAPSWQLFKRRNRPPVRC